MDISAMLVKDLGRRVEDDYGNIETLQEIGIIDEKMAERLKMCNGLRNWLVHRYSRVDRQLVLNSVEEVKEILIEFIKRVEDVLEKAKP